jgi:kynurenine formamidase
MDEATLAAVLGEGRVFDLAVEYFPGMPHLPRHIPYAFSVVRNHGDVLLAEGVSASVDLFLCGTHTGTHLDALGHFSRGGRLYGDVEAAAVQTKTAGLAERGIEEAPPQVRRGVLLDVAAAAGVPVLPESAAIGAQELEAAARRAKVTLKPGDAALVRTGWIRHWPSRKYYEEGGGVPGVTLEGARWLSGQGIALAGSDNFAFERIPSPSMPVHCHFLVERGIFLLEVANLEALSAAGATTFLLAVLPLKLKGATGSPVRPVAIL